MRKGILIFLKILGIILILVSCIFIGIFVYSIFFANNNYTIGIIGGADGPTSIFITGRLGIYPLIPIVGAVIGVALLFVSGKKLKNKE